jgi:molybdenum cofactor cytidylyltransferase
VAADIRGILLCGGLASRFGGDKLLAGAAPIAVDAARNLEAAVERVLAVIPLGKPRLRQALEGVGCEVLETDRTSRGMAGSIVAGIESAEAADGWIIALGDMPRVRPATIRAIAAALQDGAAIAVPVDASGRRGHPVGFSSRLRGELLALEGDVGARSVLARHDPDTRGVLTDDAGIFIDIDTPADLAALGTHRREA